MNPYYQKSSKKTNVYETDQKPAAIDFTRVQKVVKYSRRYEQEVRYEPVWTLAHGANQPFGEPHDITVCSKERTYYIMKSRWKKNEENDKDTIVPLAMRSYYDGEKFEDNYWCSDDEEGVNQYFYHDKKSPNGYQYAGTQTVKYNVKVPDGYSKMPYQGLKPRYNWTNDYGTKIFVPFEKYFKTRCDLDTDT
jgi:hypothetical protein